MVGELIQSGKELIWKTAATAIPTLHLPPKKVHVFKYSPVASIDYLGLFAVQKSKEFCRWQKR